MFSPFLLLAEWGDALRDPPAMPGLALLMEPLDPDTPEGDPHSDRCACPDCSDESPILED